MTLEGKSVLVLGGSSGMGLAVARSAAAEGAKVTVLARNAERLKQAVDSIGNGATGSVVDAVNDNSVEAFFKDAPEYDHVVLSAGAGGRGRIENMTMPEAFAAMDGKFWAYFRIARAVKIAEKGSLTFITGGLSQKSAPEASVISAVNAAIEGLAKGLVLDMAPVRVNCLCPGLIESPMWDRMPAEKRRAMYDNAQEKLPARRLGQPEDVAHAALFFMTNPYATGSLLVLDGGSLAT